jgi:hypothetical protein
VIRARREPLEQLALLARREPREPPALLPIRNNSIRRQGGRARTAAALVLHCSKYFDPLRIGGQSPLGLRRSVSSKNLILSGRSWHDAFFLAWFVQPRLRILRSAVSKPSMNRL